jgi:hypothetical protein
LRNEVILGLLNLLDQGFLSLDDGRGWCFSLFLFIGVFLDHHTFEFLVLYLRDFRQLRLRNLYSFGGLCLNIWLRSGLIFDLHNTMFKVVELLTSVHQVSVDVFVIGFFLEDHLEVFDGEFVLLGGEVSFSTTVVSFQIGGVKAQSIIRIFNGFGVGSQSQVSHRAVAVGCSFLENVEGLGVAIDSLLILFTSHELVSFKALIFSFTFLGNTTRETRISARIFFFSVENIVCLRCSLFELAISLVHLG